MTLAAMAALILLVQAPIGAWKNRKPQALSQFKIDRWF